MLSSCSGCQSHFYTCQSFEAKTREQIEIFLVNQEVVSAAFSKFDNNKPNTLIESIETGITNDLSSNNNNGCANLVDSKKNTQSSDIFRIKPEKSPTKTSKAKPSKNTESLKPKSKHLKDDRDDKRSKRHSSKIEKGGIQGNNFVVFVAGSTQYDALNNFSISLTDFWAFLFEYSTDFQNTIALTYKGCASLDKLKKCFQQIENYKNLMKTSALEKEKNIIKITKKCQEKVTNGHCKPNSAVVLYNKVKSLRKGSQRHSVLEAVNVSLTEYKKTVAEMIAELKDRSNAVREMLKSLEKTNDNLGDRLIHLSNKFTKKYIKKINFKKDITHFVTQNKIIRYDLQCNIFKPIDMNHNVFNQVSKSVINFVPVPPIYPIALALVKYSFFSEAPNELSVQKGKTVLMMEPVDDGKEKWILCMNPFTRASGFVPATHLEKAGNALGVVLQSYTNNADGTLFQKGDYVAVESEEFDQYKTLLKLVRTVKNEKTKVPAKLLGVIYCDEAGHN